MTHDPSSPADAPLLTVVAIGASAGGLEPLNELLHALPADTGMAFVVIQHLDPRRPSMLTDILGRATPMPVVEARDGMKLEANRVFVIAPNTDMLIEHDALVLSARTETRGQHRPIDRFLLSLAQDHTHRAIGVILSGTASDGTQGMAAINAEGGITFAQDESAIHDSMPRSAIAAGVVDHVMPPIEIARELVRIARHPHFGSATWRPPEEPKRKAGLDRIVDLLQSATNMDFSHYRGTTLYRRITRRMALHHMEHLNEYISFLQETPAEAHVLYNDILINVTSFFRDSDTFDYVKQEVFPRLTKDRGRRDPIRIWVLGCSTGEEAYSIAIILAEYMESQTIHPPVQIYATDLNNQVIEKARAGLYPREITQDVSPERLSRFFIEQEGGYRIIKSIRDMCVFASQNVLTDPPFSRMDLVSCRNLLIYLEPVLQKRIVPALHYSLKPNGVLWLGSSETIGTFTDLFEVMDAKRKIYARRAGPSRLHPVFGTDVHRARGDEPVKAEVERRAPSGDDLQREADRAVIARYVPVGVLVNSEMDILQFRGDTSPYLAPASGRASLNLLKMAREGLLMGLRATLHRAKKENRPVRKEGVIVRTPTGPRATRIEVIPLKGRDSDVSFVVVFESGDADGSTPPESVREASSAGAELQEEERQVTSLAQELAATREYLQSIVEQHEAANEELQSANEEVQSTNEELQSINEELETSKEEIQSSNEELRTVNDELQDRIAELSRANNDLSNLLVNVQVAIVIVGSDLKVRRFTSTAERILNIVSSDVGRPIGDVPMSIKVPDLGPMVAEVMDTVTPEEREVQDREGRWHLLRIRPYKTTDNRIDGAVLMMVDIDAQKRRELEFQEAREYAETIIATVREPLIVLDEQLRIVTASASFCTDYLVRRSDVEGKPFLEIAEGEWNIPELRDLLEERAASRNSAKDVRVERDFIRHGHRSLVIDIQLMRRESMSGPLLLLAIEDITERVRLETALRARIEELASADRGKNEFLAMLAHELRNPLAPISNAAHILKFPSGERETSEKARDMIERQVINMKRMIDDLLDASRVSRGRVQLRKELMDLNPLLTRVVGIARSAAPAGATIEWAAPEEPTLIDGDPTRLEQVFGNLLNNACKFISVGGHIAVSLDRDGRAPDGEHQAVVRVRDDGAGIAPEMVAHVFELFTQADRSLERRKGGLGIGLTLVRHIVELHGGTVEAHSDGLDQGAEFVIRLPIVRTRPAVPETPAEPIEHSQRSLRILVVDDHGDGADSLEMLLRTFGHEVRVARDGPGAIAAAQAFHPEVAIVDIGLPGMSGYEVARRLHVLPAPTVTLIALTGYGRDEDRRHALEVGFEHHLTKPVPPAELRQLLSSLARTRE